MEIPVMQVKDDEHEGEEMGYKKAFRYSIGNAVVDEVGTINFTGNIIPMVWFKTICYPNGVTPYTFWQILCTGIARKRKGMRKADS